MSSLLSVSLSRLWAVDVRNSSARRPTGALPGGRFSMVARFLLVPRPPARDCEVEGGDFERMFTHDVESACQGPYLPLLLGTVSHQHGDITPVHSERPVDWTRSAHSDQIIKQLRC